jgi:hypothetical protein
MSLWTLLELLADKKKRRALRETLREYNKSVAAGADPIEALHGHICGPNCWHQRLSKVSDDAGIANITRNEEEG